MFIFSSVNYSYLCSCILLFNLLSLASSQYEPSYVSPVMCIGAPCLYKGECRDKVGECGDTVLHCDAESQWVPACGGGGDVDKPAATETTAATAPQATSSSGSIESSLVERPTFSPITAWEGWTNQNNDQPNYDQGVPDPTTGQEGGSNTASNGAPDWFDPNAWDDGKNGTIDNADASMLDKTWDKVFGDDVSGAMTQVATLQFHLLAVGAWAVL